MYRLVILLVLGFTPGFARADAYEDALKNLAWRNIGPAIMGGRIDDFALVDAHPSEFYVATASGGVFHTVNNGTTWTPVFDNQPTSSVGAVAVNQADSKLVWVGTGESNNRQSSSWGNGVYKSTDAGKTWTHMGLAEQMHCARIIIDPRNAAIVHVAASGRL